jgi:hypothetical protein
MGTSNGAFCGTFEDEMHCFMKCQRLGPLWAWISNILHASCPWIKDLTEAELLFGYSELHATDKHLQIWQPFHAELIRDVIGFPEVEKFSIMKYCIYKPLRALLCADVSIYESNPRISEISLMVWKKAFANNTTKHGRIKLNIM